jgi:hypothetical protein
VVVAYFKILLQLWLIKHNGIAHASAQESNQVLVYSVPLMRRCSGLIIVSRVGLTGHTSSPRQLEPASFCQTVAAVCVSRGVESFQPALKLTLQQHLQDRCPPPNTHLNENVGCNVLLLSSSTLKLKALGSSETSGTTQYHIPEDLDFGNTAVITCKVAVGLYLFNVYQHLDVLAGAAESHKEPFHQDDGSMDWCCVAVRHFLYTNASLSLSLSLSLLFSYFVHLISGFSEPPFERKS